MRSDAAFDTVYQKADELAKKLHLSPPLVPRAKKAPKRYESSSDAPTASAQIDAITNLRKEYFAVIDRETKELERRFCNSHAGLSQLGKLETILLSAADGRTMPLEELKQELGVHQDDFDSEKLHAQLVMLSSALNQSCNSGSGTSVSSIITAVG